MEDDYGTNADWGGEGHDLNQDLRDLLVRRRDVSVKVELERVAREKLIERMAFGNGLDQPKTLAEKYANSPKKSKYRSTSPASSMGSAGSPSRSSPAEHGQGAADKGGAGFATPLQSPIRGSLRPKSANAMSSSRSAAAFLQFGDDDDDACGVALGAKLTSTTSPLRAGSGSKDKDTSRLPGKRSESAAGGMRASVSDADPRLRRPKSAHSKTRPLKTKAQRDADKELRRSIGEMRSARRISAKLAKDEAEKQVLEEKVFREIREMEKKIYTCIEEANTHCITLKKPIYYSTYLRTDHEDVAAQRLKSGAASVAHTSMSRRSGQSTGNASSGTGPGAISDRLVKLQITRLDRSTGTETLISVDRFFLDHAKLYSLVQKRRALLPSQDVIQERLAEREREHQSLRASSRFGGGRGLTPSERAAARRDVTPLPPSHVGTKSSTFAYDHAQSRRQMEEAADITPDSLRNMLGTVVAQLRSESSVLAAQSGQITERGWNLTNSFWAPEYLTT